MVAAYAVLAVVLTYPLFADLGGSVLDPVRPWHSGWLQGIDQEPLTRAMLRDIHLFVWVYAWNWHALITDPTSWFDANAFHPARDALAFSEHALGKLPITGPLQALTDNAVLAYQADLLASFALSGAALYALVRALGAARGAAFLAGLVYAFAPARIDSLYHTYLLAGQYFPLALLFLDRGLFSGRARDAAAFAVFLLLQMLSSYYVAYQAVFALLAYGVAIVWTTRARLPWRGVTRVGIAAGAVAVVFGLVSLPYLRVRSGGAILSYGPLVDALVPMSNLPWRSYLVSPYLVHAGVGPVPTRGGFAYLGVFALALAVIGALPASGESAPRRRLRVAALLIALVSWVMALGPYMPMSFGRVPLPYLLAMKVVPGFDSMRVPSRFALMMMLGFAVLVGLGADRALRALARRGVRPVGVALATAAVAAAIVLDYGYGVVERFSTRKLLAGPNAPPVYAELARLPRGPLLELPLSRLDGLRASYYMVQSTKHWMPLLEGSSGYIPPSQQLIVDVARRLPDPEALRLLGRMTGLRYVVVHLAELPPAQQAAWRAPHGLRLLGRYGDDLLFEVEDPPDADLEPQLVRCAHERAACAPLRELVTS